MNKIIRATLLTSLLLSCSSGAWASLSETMATRCEGDGTSFSPTQIYYVSPTGLASNSGANSAQAMDFQTALSTVRAGEMILLEAGTYAIDYQQGEKTPCVLVNQVAHLPLFMLLRPIVAEQSLISNFLPTNGFKMVLVFT